MEDEDREEPTLTQPTLLTEFNPERRELAIAYTRTSRRYSIRLMIISFLISVGVLFSRVTVFFRDIMISLGIEDPFMLTGLFFLVGFLIVNIGELPVSFYMHSRLSRRYGLSKLTNKK